MKLIPCAHGCKFATLPGGEPYTLARAPELVLKGRCAGCKMPIVLSLAEFVRLPDLSLDDLRRLGVADHLVLNDLRGMGATDAHIAQMEAMGVEIV